MKTPHTSKVCLRLKSLSDERFPRRKSTVDGQKFKIGGKVKNLKRLKPKFRDYKPEVIPTPKTPKQPKETLRRSLSKLKSCHQDQYLEALRDIVQISRFNPQLLHKSMRHIYRAITKFLNSLRTSDARMACQAANELFMNVQYGKTPEFVELVHTLLQKTGHSNKSLQSDALEALNSMIIHIPPAQSVNTLLHRRIAGYNLTDNVVRTTATKLLACVLDHSDAHPVKSLKEDTTLRLACAGIQFLRDNSPDIQYYGMRLMTMLVQRKDFQEIFEKNISAGYLLLTN